MLHFGCEFCKSFFFVLFASVVGIHAYFLFSASIYSWHKSRLLHGDKTPLNNSYCPVDDDGVLCMSLCVFAQNKCPKILWCTRWEWRQATISVSQKKINEEFVVLVHLNVINVEMRLYDVCKTEQYVQCTLCNERREEPLTLSSTNFHTIASTGTVDFIGRHSINR